MTEPRLPAPLPMSAWYIPPADRIGVYKAGRPIMLLTSTGQKFRLTEIEARMLGAELKNALENTE